MPRKRKNFKRKQKPVRSGLGALGRFGLAAFRLLRRSFAALTALALGFVLVAMAGYNPGDPSLNSATSGGVRNPMGRIGAIVADFLWQSAGILWIMPLAFAFIWALYALRRRRFSFPAIRFASMLIAQILLLVALANLPPKASAVLGGALMQYLLFLMPWLKIIHSDNSYLGWSLAAPLMTGALYFFFLSTNLWNLLKAAVYPIVSLARFGRWPRKITVQKQEPPAKPARPSKPQPVERSRPAAVAAMPKPAQKHGFNLPGLDLLDNPKGGDSLTVTREMLEQNARRLERALAEFGVKGHVLSFFPGPVVTLYEFEPAAGTKTARVISLADDVARSLSVVSVRIAVIPGRNALGIELPNDRRKTVFVKELLATEQFMDDPRYRLTLALGKDIAGKPAFVGLEKMPHLLVAGTTGSGKSVAMNVMLMSLLYRLTPDECRLILIDPKMLEFSAYNDIPHLLTPVVTESPKAIVALKWAVREMESRYRMMSRLGVRNLDGFNAKVDAAVAAGESLTFSMQTGFDEDGQPMMMQQDIPPKRLPYIVIAVDEMADLMLVAGKDVEAAIQRLAQMARAAGIHLIMATQRPSVDVITGTIKANFPTRISFHVTSKIDSRTILGEQGAESLLGHGDMLYMPTGQKAVRLHGPFISDDEIQRVTDFLRKQGAPMYCQEVTADPEADSFGDDGEGGGADIYSQAVAIVRRDRKPTISYLQRQL
ncbi:MAG: DNA translocase FtsK 4TM domain-containing protein, partial [Alphaproteobacteria bacterium]|nr:DNA translocase FtsK 4TM domain-containing protein [Alphaproteobacteria bacterium]